MNRFNKPILINQLPEVWAIAMTNDQILFADLTNRSYGEKSGEKLLPFKNKADFKRYVWLYVYKGNHYIRTEIAHSFLMRLLRDKATFPDIK